MIVGDGGHSGGEEVAFHVDPVAAEGGYLADEGVEGISGMSIPYVSSTRAPDGLLMNDDRVRACPAAETAFSVLGRSTRRAPAAAATPQDRRCGSTSFAPAQRLPAASTEVMRSGRK